MGYDITAYFNVDQESVEEFINSNNIDRNDDNTHYKIVKFFRDYNPWMHELSIGALYMWNKQCEIHEFFDFYRTNFIRDDERFRNKRYHKILEEKYQRKFPHILTDINLYLNTPENAIEIADELTHFFADDENLIDFAKWLRKTSPYCSMYELSR